MLLHVADEHGKGRVKSHSPWMALYCRHSAQLIGQVRLDPVSCTSMSTQNSTDLELLG